MTSSNTPRDCWCDCGGITKGGKFLPGHDAKFVAWQVTRIQYGFITPHKVRDITPSPALWNKVARALHRDGWTYHYDFDRWMDPQGNWVLHRGS